METKLQFAIAAAAMLGFGAAAYGVKNTTMLAYKVRKGITNRLKNAANALHSPKR
ncbi:MAG: hypothetical protein PHW76_09730 [Alphaproteobacteria bacterium]|nr:hypothetical protein [Alphaproteobacteria bacterium]